MTRRAGLYAHVSTSNGHQDLEVQPMALGQAAERAGWQVVEEYVDHGISGAKGRDKRPAFRSLQDPVGFLGDVHAQGIDLYLDRLGVDTTTPGGKALFQMMGVFAEFEREIIRERVCAGLEKAKARGRRLGRPTVSASVEGAIRAARQAGKGQLAIARDLHVWREHRAPSAGGHSRNLGACLKAPRSLLFLRSELDPARGAGSNRGPATPFVCCCSRQGGSESKVGALSGGILRLSQDPDR
jgi:DNA invertase Pin-like site-specific DNA recombinase